MYIYIYLQMYVYSFYLYYMDIDLQLLAALEHETSLDDHQGDLGWLHLRCLVSETQMFWGANLGWKNLEHS